MFRSPAVDAIVVIVILLLIVGPKKLPQLGRGLGEGMREFKDGITGSDKGKESTHEPESLSQAKAMPGSDTADERPAQPAATGRDAGSEPRA